MIYEATMRQEALKVIQNICTDFGLLKIDVSDVIPNTMKNIVITITDNKTNNSVPLSEIFGDKDIKEILDDTDANLHGISAIINNNLISPLMVKNCGLCIVPSHSVNAQIVHKINLEHLYNIYVDFD